MTIPLSRIVDDSQGGEARAANLFIVYLKELPLQTWVEAARWRALVPKMADAERTVHLTRVRFATDHLQPATERAALAVLVQSHLSADDFATLYAPFEPVIPSALLFGFPR